MARTVCCSRQRTADPPSRPPRSTERRPPLSPAMAPYASEPVTVSMGRGRPLEGRTYVFTTYATPGRFLPHKPAPRSQNLWVDSAIRRLRRHLSTNMPRRVETRTLLQPSPKWLSIARDYRALPCARHMPPSTQRSTTQRTTGVMAGRRVALKLRGSRSRGRGSCAPGPHDDPSGMTNVDYRRWSMPRKLSATTKVGVSAAHSGAHTT